jgi:hypothetical protein
MAKKDNSCFMKAGGSSQIMTIHTGKQHTIALKFKMGEIPNGTKVRLNNKTAKEGDEINLGDTIKIEWGEWSGKRSFNN